MPSVHSSIKAYFAVVNHVSINHVLKFPLKYGCVECKPIYKDERVIVGFIILKWRPRINNIFTYGVDKFFFRPL